MRTFTVVVERDPDTGLFVGHVPGWPGAHSQGASLDELQANLQEVVSMLLEDGEPKFGREDPTSSSAMQTVAGRPFPFTPVATSRRPCCVKSQKTSD